MAGYSAAMTNVEVFIDPSCPWAWVTSRWLQDVAPQRDLVIFWRSYCLEIRDDYGVAPTVPDEYRQQALDGHAASHRMLRIFEAARAEGGEEVVDRLYTEWGARNFGGTRPSSEALLTDCISAAGLDAGLRAAADDEGWDDPIRDAMEVAYAFGGPKTQTPTIVVRADPAHGFKGPVMAPAPTGPDAVQLWDAIQVLSEHRGFFENHPPPYESPETAPS
jgi:predicted DsbA family dithiol-disulfide isomerase